MVLKFTAEGNGFISKNSIKEIKQPSRSEDDYWPWIMNNTTSELKKVPEKDTILLASP